MIKASEGTSGYVVPRVLYRLLTCEEHHLQSADTETTSVPRVQLIRT